MRRPLIILLEAPPRHYKTMTLLQHIARVLKYRPTWQVMYASYAGGLAFRKSRLVRDIAVRAGVFASGQKVNTTGPDGQRFNPSQTVSHWQTREGGGLIAGGRSGQYVGEGAQLIVIDDPFRDRAEAESEVVQEAVFEDLFQGTLFPRLEPGASLIITHQPWNDRDLIARVLAFAKEEGIEVRRLSYPAVRNARYDDRDRLVAGKPLMPHRFGIKALRRIQSLAGVYNFESQYQCNRVPRGKRVFVEPIEYDRPHSDHAILAISCDPGIDKDKKSDASGYVIAYGYVDSQGSTCMDILLAEERRDEIPDTVDHLEELAEPRPGAPIVLEEVSAFKALGQVARRLDLERVKRGEQPARLPIVSWTPVGSKFVRALPTAAAVRFGRIRVPRDAHWVAAYREQLRRFTGRDGVQDNMVDATTQLYDYFEKRLRTAKSKPRTGSPSEVLGQAF